MRIDSRKFLPVGVILLITTLAVHGTTTKERPIIKDVSFRNTGDSLEAKITTGENAKYTYFELKSPHRLVVDFHGIRNTIRFKEKNIGAAGVERVRTSFYSDGGRKATRIVFDLAKDVPYRLIEDNTGAVRIVFGSTARAPQNQTAGPVVVPEPASYSIAGSASPALKLASLLPAPEVRVPEQVAGTISRAQAPLSAAVGSTQQQTQVTVVPPSAPQVPTTPTPIPQYQGELISIDI